MTRLLAVGARCVNPATGAQCARQRHRDALLVTAGRSHCWASPWRPTQPGPNDALTG